MPNEAPCEIIFVCDAETETWHIEGTSTDVTALVNSLIGFSEFDRCRLTDMGSIVVSWTPGDHGGLGASAKASAGKKSGKSAAGKSSGGGKPTSKVAKGSKKSSRR